MDLFSEATKLEKRIVLSATQKRIPLGGAFELLPLCNMNCRMCFLRLSPEEMKQQGRLRTADEWLALAKEAKEAGLLFLLLTGGEPFLYPEFEKLYKGLCELGLIITLNTNGTLITEAFADLLYSHKPRRVNITLYGSSDEIYARLCNNPKGFTQTMKAIQLLKERDIAVKLNGSVTSDNIEDLEEIQRIAHELDIPLEVNTYMFPSARKGCMPFEASSRVTPREAAESYVKVKKDTLSEAEFNYLTLALAHCYRYAKDFEGDVPAEPMPCRAGLSSFWVNWKGNMTPCVFMETPAIPVFEEGFNTSWEFVKAERDKMFMPKKCTTCGKRKCCTVCAAAAITETGSLAEPPEYVCQMTDVKLKLMNEILELNR